MEIKMPDVNRDMDLQDVADVINNEGLGYAIHSYLSSERIEDKRLRDAWQRAYEAMNEIEGILGRKE